MFGLGAPELMILLVIVIVLFGAGRIGKIAGELGSGIRNFREAMQDKNENKVE
jgi:sec-independent protein translocase protein TatA